MGNEYYKNPFTWEMLFSDVNDFCDAADAWFKTEDFKKWAADKPPEFNAFAYLDMVREREYANRLEF